MAAPHHPHHGHEHHGHDHDDHGHAHHGHDDHDHGGHAGHHHAPASFGTAFAVGAVLNVGLVAAQIGYGIAANSVALLADAAHNLGDVLALLLAWGAAVLGRRLPSARRTYGWGRSTILAALVNAVTILVSAGAIAVEALHRFAEPAPVGSVTVMLVAGIGIAVNGATAWLFSRGHDDLNIRGVFLHMAGDAAVSAGVVLAAGLILFTGWQWLDPLASLLIVAVIGWSSWRLLHEALSLAMDGVPARVDHAAVNRFLDSLPGVVEVHDLHIWALSTTSTALTAHLVCDGSGDPQTLIQQASDDLATRFAIGHATLQLETPDSATSCRLRPAHVV